MYTTYETSSTNVDAVSIFIYICACIIWLPFMAFWIWMIIDAAKREYASSETKLPWLLAIIFGGVIPAIVYFFKIKRTDDRSTRPAVVVEATPEHKEHHHKKESE
jgi:hypothetical protein